MARRTLNDRIVNTLKVTGKTKKGKPRTRLDVMDSVVPGFGVRVTDKGQKTYVLVHRFPGKPHPTRRMLGEVGALTLAKARDKARSWLELISKDKDPAAEEEREQRQKLRQRKNTFAAVAEDFIRLEVIGPDPEKPRQRKGREVARDVRGVFIPLWGHRPVADIARDDVALLIESVRDYGTASALAILKGKTPKTKGHRAPGQARNLLGYLKTLFTWAIDCKTYGLESSPAADLKAKRLIGKKPTRERILSTDEIGAFWRATGRMGYPYGPLYRMLLLSGLRLNEAADAAWPEINARERTWVIPALRMKGKEGEARPHAVPLTPDMLEILEALPRFKRGKFLFSTTFGVKPVWVNAKIKDKLDQRMLSSLRALARKRGDDPDEVTVEHWVNHDLRRTMRSGLSRLRIPEEVREAVLGHVRPGVKKNYDLHDYFDEKLDALEQWAARLRSILAPKPTAPPASNVVSLPAMRA